MAPVHTNCTSVQLKYIIQVQSQTEIHHSSTVTNWNTSFKYSHKL